MSLSRLLPLCLALTLAACGDKGDDDDDTGGAGDDSGGSDATDTDGDGFPDALDCAPEDAATYPGAPEVCDGADNDCDEVVDEEPTDGTTWFIDADGDTYGATSYTQVACDQPTGFVDNSDDCDDLSAAAVPGGTEVCDGVDNDCDGAIDDDAADMGTFYADGDADGYGDPATTTEACEAPSGYVADNTDCDDADAAINPENVSYGDLDGDGYGGTVVWNGCDAPSGFVDNSDDCDDGNAGTYPGATEVCDGADNDCDTAVDDDDSDVVGQSTWYADADADGFGDPATELTQCFAPSGYIADGSDCDDGSDAAYPGAREVCDDGVDNDCSGALDEGCPVDVEDADVFLYSGASSDYLGYKLAADGDLDGDGYDDLLVGAYGDDTVASSAGMAYVVDGATSIASGPVASAASAWGSGSSSYDYAGYSVDIVPDLDGDGYDDLLIGAYGSDLAASSAGAVGFAYGPVSGAMASDALLVGVASSDYLGQYVMQDAGDLDGDGTGDLIFGAHGADPNGYSSGAAYVFFGGLSGAQSASAADLVIVGSTSYGYVGYTAATGGDLDGDGYDDLVLGESGEDNAFAFLGPLSAGTATVTDGAIEFWDSSYVAESLGSMARTGDFDGDGYDDLALGAKYDDTLTTDGGSWYILAGPFTGSSYDVATDAVAVIADGSGTYNYFGGQYNGVAVGDHDADGSDDLLLGSYSHDSVASSAGGAFLFHGPVSGTLTVTDADEALLGMSSSSYVGYGVDFGDMNGDGDLDIIVGERGYDSSAGAVGIFYGPDLH